MHGSTSHFNIDKEAPGLTFHQHNALASVVDGGGTSEILQVKNGLAYYITGMYPAGVPVAVRLPDAMVDEVTTKLSDFKFVSDAEAYHAYLVELVEALVGGEG